MADDKNTWTDPANAEEKAIKHLAEHTDLSPLQAKQLVAEHGTDLGKLEEIARTRKAEG